VRLFGNRSQRTSKCGKNKKVAHEAIAECVTDVQIRVLNERRVTNGGNLYPLWLVILKLVSNGIGDTLWLQYSWPRDVVSYTFLAVVP